MRAVSRRTAPMARRWASATAAVDALTFGLGSGIAGMAGVALSQIDQCQPQPRSGLHHRLLHGRGVRRRRQPVRHADRRDDAGRRQQVPGTRCRRRAGKILVLVFIILFIQKRPRGLFALKGRAWRSNDHAPFRCSRAWTADRGCSLLLGCSGCGRHRAGAAGQPAAARDSAPATYMVQLLGKYLCYALLALAVDLVWGFCGILSLGHGAFFALGGYCMGMYLMRQIGTAASTAIPSCPDFMVFLNWKELPWYWHGFDHFWFAADGRAGAGPALAFRLRLARLPLARDRRLPVDHHPGADLRADAGLLPQRHGLRRQQRPDRLQGHPRLLVQAERHAHRALRRLGLALGLGLSVSAAVVTSKLGGAGGGARRREPHALPRLPGRGLQAVRLRPVGGLAGIAGALYVPQVGIINPGEFAPAIRSRSSSGSRSAGAARSTARCSAPSSSTSPRPG
jgi:hypothetical protein